MGRVTRQTLEDLVRRRRARCALLLVAVLLASGCALQQLQFRIDHRVHIDSPRDRSRVNVPLKVSWSYRDFTVTGPDGGHDPHSGYFGVFVDQAPIPVGKNLRWVAHGDRSCLPSQGCPNAQYLANRYVYTTTQPSLVLSQLPQLLAQQGIEHHEITVVLLDGSGDRLLESAWFVDFTYRRPSL